MDLEVKEVSTLLNVPVPTLLGWIQEGKIPAYFLNERYRFNRAEIEEWVMQQKVLEEKPEALKEKSKTTGQQQFNLYRAVHKGEVYTHIEDDNKEAVIKTVMRQLAPKLSLDPEVLTDLIMEREQLMSTTLGAGFGIPHARDFHLPGSNDVVAVVFLAKPILYDALDGLPVHTLFFLLACDDKRHLSLLAKIAHLVKSPGMAEKLANRPNKAALLEMVKDWETGLNKA